MSKSDRVWHDVAIWVVSAFAGLLAFVFTQSIFMLFFVSIVVGVMWNSTNRVERLEERLSQVEPRPSVDQSGTRQEHPNSQTSS
jgi:hypothetical protein